MHFPYLLAVTTATNHGGDLRSCQDLHLICERLEDAWFKLPCLVATVNYRALIAMKLSFDLCTRCAIRLSRSQIKSSVLPAGRRWISTAELPAVPRRQGQYEVTKNPRRAATSFTGQTSPSFSDDPYITSLGTPSSERQRALLQPNNLFHPFSDSPSPEIRRRAAFMKQHAYCPHPSHHRTRLATSPADPENRKPMPATPSAHPPAPVRYECPDCGIPVSCSETHWMDDYESHLEICPTLRQINEDDHDLRSGRFFPEFDYPGPQRAEEFVLNMSNWDTFLYTRDFNAIDDPRSMRQVTRLLTYPITIASVLHEFSPYNIRRGGRLTTEGLRSFSGTYLISQS